MLPEALQVARSIADETYRTHALTALAVPLSKMPTTELFSLWQDTLHKISQRSRKDLLQDISALVPVLFALSDQLAVAEVATAINDVARWWR